MSLQCWDFMANEQGKAAGTSAMNNAAAVLGIGIKLHLHHGQLGLEGGGGVLHERPAQGEDDAEGRAPPHLPHTPRCPSPFKEAQWSSTARALQHNQPFAGYHM